MNNIWVVMFIGGAITFLIRFSLIYLFGKFQIPETMRRALHYVPPAVLSALVFPEVFLPNGTLDISLGNDRLIAGVAAVIAAWFSKNMLVTIVVGMAVLLVLQAFV